MPWVWRGISVKIIDFSHGLIILAIAEFDFSHGLIILAIAEIEFNYFSHRSNRTF